MSRVKAKVVNWASDLRGIRGGGGGEAASKRKVFGIFLNKVTVFAVLKLTSSEFQVTGAAIAKALDPHFIR